MTHDGDLLRQYTETDSEEAFAELVRRHSDLVYSAALRQVNEDASLAQDVAQAVFTDLARKAVALSERPALAGWLYTSTHFAAAKAVRTEHRRRAREEKAQAMHETPPHPASGLDWEKLRPVLDAAMHQLKAPDRDAILMRYFENRQLVDIAKRLGVSEDATRKRVERAMEKLRGFLFKRGITTTATLVSMLSTHAVQTAPAGLAAAVSSASLAGAMTGSGTTLALLKIMSITKLKLGLAALVVTGVATTLVVQYRSQTSLREENDSLRSQIAHLQTDNEALSNRVANAVSSSSLKSDRLRELLKLRGEVGVLRERQAELEQMVAAARSRTPGATEQAAWATAPQQNQRAPFQVQLVVDEPGDNSELLTTDVGDASGKTLHVRKTPLLDHTAISSVTVTRNMDTGTPQIDVEFSEVGKELFAQVTKENLNKRLAIVLDGHLYSAPVIREEISGGKAQITGSFTEEEAKQLAAKINETIPAK
jgi:RNA polymerase sigma factor (sigma-70 family)